MMDLRFLLTLLFFVQVFFFILFYFYLFFLPSYNLSKKKKQGGDPRFFWGDENKNLSNVFLLRGASDAIKIDEGYYYFEKKKNKIDFHFFN